MGKPSPLDIGPVAFGESRRCVEMILWVIVMPQTQNSGQALGAIKQLGQKVTKKRESQVPLLPINQIDTQNMPANRISSTLLGTTCASVLSLLAAANCSNRQLEQN